jgi:hypothetical protein
LDVSNWRKLHLARDADSGDIIAHVMTGPRCRRRFAGGATLDPIGMPIGQVIADGA